MAAANPGLGVTQAGTAGHHGEEGPRQPSLQVLGDGTLLDRLAEHGRDHVGGAGQGQEGQPDPQHGDDAEQGDGRPPHHDAGGDGPTLVADPAAPAGEERADQGPGPGGGVEQADHARPLRRTAPTPRAGKTARGIPKIMALRSIQ